MTGLQQRLAIEAPPKMGNMCVFHLTTNHNGESCPKVVRMMHLLTTNELNYSFSSAKIDSYLNGDYGNLLLEYESYLERQGECYTIIDGTTYTILMRGKNAKLVDLSSPLGKHDPTTSETQDTNQGMKIIHFGKELIPFDFVQFCKEFHIQISPIDYLKSSLPKLKKFVEHC